MDYRVDIDNENGIVLCVCKGTLDLETAKTMVRDVRKKAYDLSYGLLYDVKNLSADASVLDSYSFPRDKKTIYEVSEHGYGPAAIVYQSDKDFWTFFEITARNAGVLVSLFAEKKEAIEWLSKEKTSSTDVY